MNALAAIPSPKVETDRRSEMERHEPSMDEILASIRRIISEDQAQVAPKAEAAQSVNPLPPPPKPEGVLSRRPATPSDLGNAVERLRRALEPAIEKAPENAFAPPEPKPFVPPKPVRPPAPPLRTEDKSMPAAVPVRPPVVEAVPDFAPEVKLDLAPVEPEAALSDVATQEIQVPHIEEAVPVVAAPATPFPALERAFPGAAPVLERVAATQPVSPPPASPITEPTTAPAFDTLSAPLGGSDAALLSPSADASIASSFQTLATTMLFQDKGLVEDMVREMLRPMLKSWLDDNLPVMVERLVRAEIERVARGGRG
jgi:cell pole-organizing protein PopZ